MPRITKAMLEEDNERLNRRNGNLMREIEQLKIMKQLLLRKDFDVGGFCRMHEEAISVIAHVVTDLREVLKRLH